MYEYEASVIRTVDADTIVVDIRLLVIISNYME